MTGEEGGEGRNVRETALTSYGPIGSETCTPMFMQFTGCDQPVSVFIGHKLQLTDWDNANNMGNATCATQTSIEWPCCLFPILCPHSITDTQSKELIYTKRGIPDNRAKLICAFPLTRDDFELTSQRQVYNYNVHWICLSIYFRNVLKLL